MNLADDVPAPISHEEHTCILKWLLDRAYELRLQRIGNFLYSRIVYQDGKFNKAFKLYCTVFEFIFTVSPLHKDSVIFRKFMTDSSAIEVCVKSLTNYVGPAIPKLEPNAEIFAYRNGIFHSGYYEFFFFDRQQSKAWIGDLIECNPNMKLNTILYIDKNFEWITVDKGELNILDEVVRQNPYLVKVPGFDKIQREILWDIPPPVWRVASNLDTDSL